jgi:hypothetical protein
MPRWPNIVIRALASLGVAGINESMRTAGEGRQRGHYVRRAHHPRGAGLGVNGAAARRGVGRGPGLVAPRLLDVPESESVLYVPLRSNAKTLLTGAPIATFRRRLKYASIIYERLILESGILRMQAGSGGSSSFVVPPTAEDPPRWETPRQRHAAERSPFQLSVGRETTPGVPAETALAAAGGGKTRVACSSVRVSL